MIYKQFIILFLFFIVNVQYFFAQNSAVEKARIVFNLAKEVEWLDEDEIFTYRIGVIENKDSVYNTFKGFAETNQLLKSKAVEVYKFKKIEDLNNFLRQQDLQIFYLSGKLLKHNDTIAKLFDNKSVLLVFDNAESKENCVVNLLNDPDKYYEINYKNALKHRLKLTENILLLGGDEELLREMYRDSMRVLREERANALLKLYRIEDQEKRLELRQQELLMQEQKLDSLNSIVTNQKQIIEQQKYILRKNLQDIIKQKKEIRKLKQIYTLQLNKIDSVKQELLKKQQQLELKQNKLNSLDEELVKSLKRIKTQSDYIKLGVLLFVILLSTILVLYIKNKEAEKIKQQNIIIKQKSEEIASINEELENQQIIVSEQNKLLTKQIREITSSINYARRIQLALFPIKEVLDNNFSDSFILYRPKDIVSGDFYWFRKIENKIIVVVADCTGHGVPGAFMSIMGMTFLSEITNTYNDKANIILELLREKIINSLEQEKDVHVKDGMDIALAIIDKDKQTISFAGAYNSLVKISKEEDQYNLHEYKGDNMPVGYHFNFEQKKHFTEKKISYKKGERIYMFSDGFKDQFGGKNGRKLNKKRFFDLLMKIQNKKMQEQKIELEDYFEKWMSGSKIGQVDDVLVVGLQL